MPSLLEQGLSLPISPPLHTQRRSRVAEEEVEVVKEEEGEEGEEEEEAGGGGVGGSCGQVGKLGANSLRD